MNKQDVTDIISFEPFKPIYLPEETEITSDLIEQLIEYNETNRVPRYQTLRNYYLGRAPILQRTKEETRSNNKLVHDYPGYITDVLTGIFIGKPVNYTTGQDEQNSIDVIQEVFNHNDEQDENHELASMVSKLGVGYEIVYTDEEGNIRFNEIYPDNVVYVWDDKINPEPLFAIYYTPLIDANNLFDEDESKLKVKVFGRDVNLTYVETDSGFVLQDEEMNLFNGVQIIEFSNNDDYLGDYEKVLTLIDAYNKSRSDTTNDFEEFTDALLVLQGMSNTDSHDIAQMKKDKVILLESQSGQGADWLIKNINDTALDNHLKRLEADIHKFSKVPNMSDEQFAGNSSGVAMSYKLIAMRQVIAAKERKFKRALQDRLELIISALRLKNSITNDLTYRDINIVFTTNIPVNIKENVEMVNVLSGLVSKQTWLPELYCVDNANQEIEQMEQEEDSYNLSDFAMLIDDDEEEVIEEVGE